MIGVEIEVAEPRDDHTVAIKLTSGAQCVARTGVIATGVAYGRLHSPRVEQFVGRGVHYGAATDAAPRSSLGGRWQSHARTAPL